MTELFPYWVGWQAAKNASNTFYINVGPHSKRCFKQFDATTVKHVDGDSGGGSASGGTKGSSSSIVPLLLVSFSGFLFSIEGLSAKVVIKVSTCP